MTQPRESERQEDAGVVGGWGRRDSDEPATGKTPRGRKNEEKERQRLASREVARAKNGSTSNRRARKCVDAAAKGRSGKKMPVSLGVGDAETAVGQLQGGAFLPCVTQERVREEENEEKERQRLASRMVARAKDGSASNRRARKCVDAAARVGAARRCRCRWGLGTPRQR